MRGSTQQIIVALAIGAIAAGGLNHGVSAGTTSPQVLPASGDLHRNAIGVTSPSGYTVTRFAGGSATTKTAPDDIATMNGLIYVAFANGVNKETGAPGPLGANSTVAAYDSNGAQVATYLIAGKCDGLTADPANNRLLATVNEDGNTSMFVIHPGASPVHLTFTANSYVADSTHPAAGPGAVDKDVRPPDPNPQGGTDAISVMNGQLFVSTSNPLDNTQPVLGSLTLNETAGTASVAPVLFGNAAGTDGDANNTSPSPTINVADPDSNTPVPPLAQRFGGSLLLVGESDKQLIFISNPGPSQTVQFLNVGAALGDTVFPTSAVGTLYVADTGANTVYAVTNNAWTVGQAIAASPIKSDSSAQAGGFVGSVDLFHGNVTPMITGLKSPAGLLFVPGTPPQGYWQVASDGGIFPFGNAAGYGSTGGTPLNKPIVAMAARNDATGYWLVASDGGIFPFGNAGGYGSHGGSPLNKPIVGMAPTADNGGYWLVASDGGIFPFGDAVGYGSTGNVTLNKPIAGMAPTADGNGYWLVASDGGIFPFGSATSQSYGSLGGVKLTTTIVGISTLPDGTGYWLAGADGNVWPFGSARNFGSAANKTLNQPIVAIVGSRTGQGYWLVAADGGIFPFGDAQGLGSTGGKPLNKPIVGMAAVD